MKRIVRIAAACLALLMLGACAKTPERDRVCDPAVSGANPLRPSAVRPAAPAASGGFASESGGSTDSTSDGAAATTRRSP